LQAGQKITLKQATKTFPEFQADTMNSKRAKITTGLLLNMTCKKLGKGRCSGAKGLELEIFISWRKEGKG
jgi:hypothetical protein